MKKLIYLIFLIFGIFNIKIVYASNNVTLTQGFIDNVFYTRRGGGKPYVSLQYKTFTIDNKAVYCIEPGIEIVTNSYISHETLNESPFDDKTNKLIELIGYYGYDYPNHQTLRYRMATQALIWEKTGGQIIEFWTERYGYGDYIDVTKEKNVIMNLVNNHFNVPSFNNKQFNLILGESIEITDTNKVLENFDIVKNNNLEVKNSNNALYVKPNQIGKIALELKKKKYDDEKSIIYIGNNPKTQKMAFFRYSEDVIVNLTINTIGGRVNLNKFDYNTKSANTITSLASLENAKYGIYTENDNLIATIITNQSGYAESKEKIAIGRYYLQEITPSQGYNLDKEKYYFEIDKDHLVINLTVYEKIINRDLLIIKYIKNFNTNKLEAEGNIKFNIYNHNNELVKEIITDKDGKISLNLLYGTYTIRQINTTNGYKKVDDLVITIDNNTPIDLKYTLIDLPIETKIKVRKKDTKTKNNILQEGITFKIRNCDNNTYICYNEVENSICEYKTNQNGEFITPNSLYFGNYQIEEIVKPKGYLLSSEPYHFKIDENSNVSEIENDNYLLIDLYNEPIKGSIKIHKNGEMLKTKENQLYYEQINLENVNFSLYAKKDVTSSNGVINYKNADLIKNLNTDSNGNIVFSNLDLGKYTIKETKTLNGYEIDNNEYEIILDDLNSSISIELSNKLMKGNLKIIKKDKDTNKVIPNTVISIFNSLDENLITKATDKNGIIYINDLPLGSYYLKEIQSARGYLLSDEVINFNITEKNELKEIVMFNKSNTINVPNTGIDNSTIIKIVSIIFVIVGISCLYFVKKFL